MWWLRKGGGRPEKKVEKMLRAAEREKWNRVISTGKKLIESGYSDVEVYSLISEAFHRIGDFEGAISMLSSLLEMDVNRAEVLRQLGQLYLKIEDWESAIPIYEGIIELEPDDIFVYDKLKELYLRQDKAEAAMLLYHKLASSRPNDISVHFTAAELAIKAGMYEKALAEIKTVYSLERDKYSRTLLLLKELLSATDGMIDGMKFLASIHHENGNSDNAKAICKQLIETRPNDAEIRVQLARICYDTQDIVGAIEQYEAILELSPDDIGVRKHLARLYDERERFEDAIEQYEQILEQDETATDVLAPLGQLYHKTANWDKAKAILEIATISPTLEDVEETAKVEEELLQTIRELENRVQQDVENKLLHFELAEVYQDAGWIDKAVSEYITAGANDILADDVLWERSVERLEELIELHPPSLAVFDALRQLYENRGLFAEAAQLYETLKSAIPEQPEIRVALARLYMQYASLSKAIEEYSEAVSLNLLQPEAILEECDILMEAGVEEEKLLSLKANIYQDGKEDTNGERISSSE